MADNKTNVFEIYKSLFDNQMISNHSVIGQFDFGDLFKDKAITPEEEEENNRVEAYKRMYRQTFEDPNLPSVTKDLNDTSVYDTLAENQMKRDALLAKIIEVITMILKIYPDSKEIMKVTSFSLDQNRIVTSKYYSQYQKGLNLKNEWSQSQSIVDFDSWLDENVPGLNTTLLIYSKALKFNVANLGLTKTDMKYLNDTHNKYKTILESE